jgi:hypothetical protein
LFYVPVAPFKLSDLWWFRGQISGPAFAWAGVIAFALKYNLDRIIAAHFFDRHWGLFHYWIPPRELVSFRSLFGNDAGFLMVMLATALPFIWGGVVLTLRRLRTVGLPLWLVVLFFVPFVNLIFFTILIVLPSRSTASEVEGRAVRGRLSRWLPAHPVGSALVALGVTIGLGLAATRLSVLAFSYGWGLFVALPFCLGLISSLIHGYHEPRTFGSCLSVALLATAFLVVGILVLAIEGAVCLALAAPLAGALAAIGAAVGYVIQLRFWGNQNLLLALLGVMRTRIIVQAPAARVWRWVIAFPELAAPKEWLFRAGVAYPIRARITGEGVGVIRYCEFSTGTFVEPIEVWDEPRQLRFAVTANPAPMQEWTPYAHVEPQHLRGFLVSERGEFRLKPLSGDRTELEGITWYRHHLWPASYWALWSDAIIHQIHLRVLRHIQALAEGDGK